MEITCPNCGQTCEVDEEPATGQHFCPFCDVKFNYTPQNTTENDSNSIANTAETNVDAPPNIKFILSRLSVCAIAVALSIGIAG